ncbi:hypothetical protein D918_00680 [Trichuris suis]|nr:hypothetical protein D918_00680 [Trichuris suis]
MARIKTNCKCVVDSNSSQCRHVLLHNLHCARQLRAREKSFLQAVITIQATVRSFLTRRRLCTASKVEFFNMFSACTNSDKRLPLPNALSAFPVVRRAVFFRLHEQDGELFKCLCRYLLISIEAKELELDMATEVSLNLYLRLLLTYTSSDEWVLVSSESGSDIKKPLEKLCSHLLNCLVSEGFYPKAGALLKHGLCRRNVLFKPASLSAMFSLTLRPLVNSALLDDMLHLFIVYVLSTPALTWHLKNMAKNFKTTFLNGTLLSRCTEYLCTSPRRSATFSELLPGYDVCLLGNLIHLVYMEASTCKSDRYLCVECLSQIVSHCAKNVVCRQTSVTYWHPFLGWYNCELDANLQEALPHVLKQIQLLWHRTIVYFFFHDLLKQPSSSVEKLASGRGSAELQEKRSGKRLGFLRKWKLSPTHSNAQMASGKQTCALTELVSVLTFYQKLLTIFTPLKYDLLAGLCCQDILLPKLWTSFVSSDVPNSVTYHLNLLKGGTAESDSILKSISVFFESASYLITIADDYELFTIEKPFSVAQLTEMALFCNLFTFRSIWENYIDVQAACNNETFLVLCGFLILIYNRDCRRSFTPEGFWLMKDLKAATFLAEADRGNLRAQFIIERIPHVIPRKERIKLFRKYVTSERLSNTLARQLEKQPTVITVHRSRVVEDGYRQLSLLSGSILKGTVRVKFINEQGLDEPGIDQDGVFKEFLEEVITRVFDPSLNLFKVTDAQIAGHMYPSSTSCLQENYVSLFEFIGKMLGKAGIVVDIFLARFVLNHIIGRSPSKYYSCIDELASLDADLYRQLSFIKHYEGDVSDLGLTFSCDEDVMGAIVTHDLRPGGRTIPVTNESRISYVHLMAYHRMHMQIKDQLEAFVRGFHELISPDWLKLFSAEEFQLILSGDVSDIDLHNLRKHTQYFGGFHNNHRVIKWLWEILANDFTADERRLFLKFVTSCSKPPLLGFEYLEPPFSIRCVEVAEDQDEGDTLGSVIRGFLAIRKRDPVGRLPTSSTCFNLLKLPNYQKKATLREKLRYAVNCGYWRLIVFIGFSMEESSSDSSISDENQLGKLAVCVAFPDSTSSVFSSSTTVASIIPKKVVTFEEKLHEKLDEHISSRFVFAIREDTDLSSSQGTVEDENGGVRLFLQSEVFLLDNDTEESSISLNKRSDKNRSAVDRILKSLQRNRHSDLHFKRKSDMLREAAVTVDLVE